MEQIVDVEYRELSELENKSTEELASEANLIWQQMETIGNIGMMMAAQAGKRLTVIKGRLGHGEWETWSKNNLKFSIRKANNMMRLADKMQDENSLFSKTQISADIGISKVYELLYAPEEVAEQVLQNPEISEMTVKEFKDEIKKLKLEKEHAQDALKASTEEYTNREQALKQHIKELMDDLQNREGVDPAEMEAKEKELQAVKDRLAKEKEKVKKAKEKANKEKEEAIYNAKKQAETEAKKKIDEETELLRTSNQKAAEEIDRLQKQLKNSQNIELVEFNLKFKQLNVNFNECLRSIITVREKAPEEAEKMKKALKMAMEQMIGGL